MSTSDSGSYEDESNSEGSMTSSDQDLKAEIFSTLQKIKTPSAFAYSGVTASLPNPALHIPPLGMLGVPLSTDDARKVISLASRSPFGKGEKTIVDTTVRKCWELDPNQFSLKNPEWNKAVDTIVDSVTTGLGLDKRTCKVAAELYKLLLYEPGAFFKPHKDSEKAPGMFATLVVCLPSPHEGGKLVLTHDGEIYVFETASSSSFECSYAAWYSDITHEVLPVESGYRLVLTYNLVRETNFEIPSHNLVRGSMKQLATLLEEYNSRLQAVDEDLPPILLHKLAHKYTQASLKLSTLKPPDLAQVQVLRQISTKLGFGIYLATLELEVRQDDEEDPQDEERSQTLKNMVELDGTLVEESLDYPDDALIDPTAQDENAADEEDHEGYTGNAGSPVTYWYRDTVVVLVPPSEQLDFVFKFKSNGSIIKPLFCKLMKELSTDPAQKQKLEHLCERALTQKLFGYYRQSAVSIPRYFQEAAATALDLGRFDLFDAGCKTTCNKIILANAHKLGRWAASNGVASMTDRLMKGVQIAASVASKVKFLKAVAEGFETAVPKPSSAERESLKQWSDEAIFSVVAERATLTKADGEALAQLSNAMNWSLFESKAKPIILKAGVITKITFVNFFMSFVQQELQEQRPFIETIIRNIWNEFVFETKSNSASKDNLNENDLLHIVQNTIKVLSLESVETTIIPAMLTAIPMASKECAKKLFILLVQMILKNKLSGFEFPTNATAPPSLHKRLIQALLTKFLLETVGSEPQVPTNWALPARPCKCSDCSVVNKFLQDPHQKSLDFKCSKARRYHLHQNFTDCGKSIYDVTTLRDTNPNTWRITKHRRGFQMAKSEWMKNTENAAQTLSLLENDEAVSGRLEAHLEPYHSVIMNAKVNELPDLKSLVSVPQSSENSQNSAFVLNQRTNQTGTKRGVDDIDPPRDGLAKRTRS